MAYPQMVNRDNWIPHYKPFIIQQQKDAKEKQHSSPTYEPFSPTYEPSSPTYEPSIPDNVIQYIDPDKKQDIPIQIITHYINSTIKKDKQISALQQLLKQKENLINILQAKSDKWGINI